MYWPEFVKTSAAAVLTALGLSTTMWAQTSSDTVQPPPTRETQIDPYPAPISPRDNDRPITSTPPTRLGNTPASPPAPVVDSQSDYSWLLDQLRMKRQQATAKLRAHQQTTADRDRATGDEHRRIHDLRRNYEDQDSHLQDREERVNRQLDRLERLLREHEVLNQNPPTPVGPDADQTPPQDPTDSEHGTSAKQPGMTTKPIAELSDPAQPDEEEPAEDDVVLPPSPEETTPTLSPSQVDAIALTNQAVDSLALANNLYGTREYSLALKIYSKIDQSEMIPEDKIWIRFQIANCHRQLGKLKEAERGYRIVTTAAGDSWVGQTAHWWLDATARTSRLKDRIKNLEASHEQLRKEIDEPIAEP